MARYLPDSIDAKICMGRNLRLKGNLEDSLLLLQTAVEEAPDNSQAIIELGLTLLARGNLDPAIYYLEQAITFKPDSDHLFLCLAHAQRCRGLLNNALKSYRISQSINPGSSAAMSGQADIFMRQGAFNKSYRIIRKLIDSGHADTNILATYAKLCEYHGDCREAIQILHKLIQKQGLDHQHYISACYSLGYLYDKNAQYYDAFNFFKKANNLTPYSFDQAACKETTDTLTSTFDRKLPKNNNHPAVDSELPVFIVGMPRSGTSLVEQILSSHPNVFGAGELDYLDILATTLPSITHSKHTYPECIKNTDSRVMRHLANQYIHQLRGFSKDALRITDKMPGNFLHLGLIASLFPKAKIIHCTRNPLDTCLSIYFQSFSGAHPYSSNLRDIGFYYVQYKKLMEHWKQVLPLEIFDINYEDLVNNFSSLSRQLVSFSGLQWNDRCLSYYRTDRVVATASYHQVRMPLYKTSISRWKNYDRHIDPLRAALDDQT